MRARKRKYQMTPCACYRSYPCNAVHLITQLPIKLVLTATNLFPIRQIHTFDRSRFLKDLHTFIVSVAHLSSEVLAGKHMVSFEERN